MRVLALAGVVLIGVGCGRLSFDPIDPAGDPGVPVDAHPSDGASGDATAASLVAFVQTNGVSAGTNIGASLSFPTAVTQGHLLIVQLDYDTSNGATITGVTDTRFNTYAIIGPFDGNSTRQYLAYVISQSSGSDTIDVTIGGIPTSFFEVRIFEYSGIRQTTPLASSASGGGNSMATDGAVTIVPAGQGDLLFGSSIFTGTGTAGTGFTSRSTFGGDVIEDRIAPATAIAGITATMSAGTSWAILGADFRHQ